MQFDEKLHEANPDGFGVNWWDDETKGGVRKRVTKFAPETSLELWDITTNMRAILETEQRMEPDPHFFGEQDTRPKNDAYLSLELFSYHKTGEWERADDPLHKRAEELVKRLRKVLEPLGYATTLAANDQFGIELQIRAKSEGDVFQQFRDMVQHLKDLEESQNKGDSPLGDIPPLQASKPVSPSAWEERLAKRLPRADQRHLEREVIQLAAELFPVKERVTDKHHENFQARLADMLAPQRQII